MSSNRSWKDALLKSGLPLEHMIATEIGKKGFWVSGEYPYIRPNEQGIDTEFSVDINATKGFSQEKMNWASLEVLIECKYSHPGCQWIFAPYPDIAYIPSGLVHVSQDLSVTRIDEQSLSDFEKKFPYSVRGIELSERDANPQNITRGLYQLRYAAPQLLFDCLDLSAKMLPITHNKGHINFICSILVTTAELRLLKRDVNLDVIQKDDDINSITDRVGALIFNQEGGPQIEEFIDRLFNKYIERYPKTPTRLQILEGILNGPEWKTRFQPDIKSFRQSFKLATERVFVVHYEVFGEILSNLINTIDALGNTLISYGYYKKVDNGSIQLLSKSNMVISGDF